MLRKEFKRNVISGIGTLLVFTVPTLSQGAAIDSISNGSYGAFVYGQSAPAKASPAKTEGSASKTMKHEGRKSSLMDSIGNGSYGAYSHGGTASKRTSKPPTDGPDPKPAMKKEGSKGNIMDSIGNGSYGGYQHS